jgi:hypothetical protein
MSSPTHVKSNGSLDLEQAASSSCGAPLLLHMTDPYSAYVNQQTLRVITPSTQRIWLLTTVTAFNVRTQAPERILDAPDITDDYYLNLLDWSSTNTVCHPLACCDRCLIGFPMPDVVPSSPTVPEVSPNVSVRLLTRSVFL